MNNLNPQPIKSEILAVAFAAEAQIADCYRMPRTNSQRAAEGKIVCELLAAMTGLDIDENADGPETVITDTVTQIFHYAQSEGISARTVFERALFNLECELVEEQA